MVFSSNFKINLSLSLLGKRDDGYTEIETVLYPLGGSEGELCDIVEVVHRGANSTGGGENGGVQGGAQSGDVLFSNSGIVVDAPASSNLCVRAFELMHSRYAVPRDVNIHLHKRIPFGAGLGAGSANCVAVLKACNELFALGLGDGELEALSAELGSDTPFFVRNVPALATGRGEQLEEIAVDLSGYYVLLVKPSVGVSTAEAYALARCSEPEIHPREAIRLPIGQWRGVLRNDFEEAIFQRLPVLEMIKSEIYGAGAIYASMSGSGSTIYGIFDHRPRVKFSNHFTAILRA